MAAASSSRSPPTFPGPPGAAAGAGAGAGAAGARSPTVSSSTASFLRDIADASEQRFGTPNALPGPPPSHFFPSVPRAQREKARRARLASASPPPPPPHPKDHAPTGLAALAAVAGVGRVGGKGSSPDLDEQDPEILLQRQRQAKVELAASGPFDNRRPSATSIGSAGSGSGPFPLVAKSVGTGGSGGTKRRHRDLDRTSWDAASELVRLEREKEREKAVCEGGKGKGKGKQLEEDEEKTPTPSVAAAFPGPRPVSLVNGAGAKEGGDVAMAVDGGETDERPPPVPSKSLSPELDDGRAPSFVSAETGGEEDDELADGDGDGDDAMAMDDVSMRSGLSGVSKAIDADDGENEPAKKRSRTLTTPAQTAVLNALLAKTRFPSTETREEVGKQIGMSARRVQIWFQNRRQSQKRQRDREAQESAAAVAAGHALSQHHLVQHHHYQQQQHLPHHPQAAYQHQHPYAQHAHIDPYSQQAPGAHFYPPVQPRPHDPYSSHPHAQPHPHLHAPPRPDLHHRVSAESIGSRASIAQSQHSGISSLRALSTQGSERDGLGPLPSDARMGHPFSTTSSPYGRQFEAAHTHYPHHLHQQQAPRSPLSFPPKLYFPHVPRPHPQGPPGRIRVDSHVHSPTSPVPQHVSQNGHGGEQVKLPSLSAILSPTSSAAPPAGTMAAHASAPPPQQQPPYSRSQVHAPIPVPVSHEAMFSHSPFSPPSAHAALPSPASSAASTAVPPPSSFSAGGRALFSPEPSASSFERLRISSGPLSPPPPPSASTIASPLSPLSPTATTATPLANGNRDSVDILDVAIETMAYRSSGRHLPARQLLPPLRSVLGDTAMNAKRPNKGGHSEADKALLAPILPSINASASEGAGGPPRLAPISTFAPLTAPSPPSAHATIPVSPASSAAPSAYLPPPVGSTPPSNLRASTWSANSHGTTATRSTADFDFAHPPAGSYREQQQQQRYANGSASGWAVPPLGGGGGSGGGLVTRERGDSTATSARTSVSSEPGK
ncbi:hypothetical protein JCM11251_005769 [Rhodosporidiobolus azoricus]